MLWLRTICVSAVQPTVNIFWTGNVQRERWLTIMPMAPSARLALRLVGAVGIRSTFCDSSACIDATCKSQAVDIGLCVQCSMGWLMHQMLQIMNMKWAEVLRSVAVASLK